MSSFSKCDVCTDPETPENKILCCFGCHVRVHMLCYGIRTHKKKWKCSPCLTDSKRPICDLCTQSGGAFKKTSNGNWTHVVCALFIEGVNFGSKAKMEPINISNIPENCHNKLCEFCLNSDGVCCSCSYPNCNRWVHVTCAQKENCLKEVLDEKNKIKFLAYCENHLPSKRRISSVFVRDKLAEMDDKSPQEPDTDGIEDSNDCDEPNNDVNDCEGASQQAAIESELSNDKNDDDVVELNNDVNDSEAASQQAAIESELSNDKNDDDVVELNNDVNDSEAASQQATNASELSNEKNDDDMDKPKKAEHHDVNEMNNYTISSIKMGSKVEDIDGSQYWWDYRDLLHQLELKNQKIVKLKEKKKSLKGNLKSMRDENLDLQLQIDKLASELKEQALLFAHDKANALQQKQKKDHLKDKLKGMRDENSDLKLQIEQLNSRLQKQTLSTKHDDMNACFNMVSNSMDGVLKTLQNRITTQFSTDGSMMIFPNNVEVSVHLMNQLEIISNEEASDRKFINESFGIFFSDKYLHGKIREGTNRENLLTECRKVDRHATMKDLYEFRVRHNGIGNVDSRVHDFKDFFRTKLNNWWQKYEREKKKLVAKEDIPSNHRNEDTPTTEL